MHSLFLRSVRALCIIFYCPKLEFHTDLRFSAAIAATFTSSFSRTVSLDLLIDGSCKNSAGESGDKLYSAAEKLVSSPNATDVILLDSSSEVASVSICPFNARYREELGATVVSLGFDVT